MTRHDLWHFVIPFVVSLVCALFCLLMNVVIAVLMLFVLCYAYDYYQLFGDLDANYGGFENFKRDSLMDIHLCFIGITFGLCIGFIAGGLF